MDSLKQSFRERVKQRSINHQITSNNLRKAIFHPQGPIGRVSGWMLPISKDFLGMLTGSICVMYIVAWVTNYFTKDRDCIINGIQYWTSHCVQDGIDYMRFYEGVNTIYIFAGLGVLYSAQATLYKYRMYADPEYVPPKCKCGNKPTINVKAVLQSEDSSLFLGIPNSIFGIGFYPLIAYLTYIGYTSPVIALLVIACTLSLYLGYKMVYTVGSLCTLCVNIYAINILLIIKTISGY
jgi:uncharacterized membrane protein